MKYEYMSIIAVYSLQHTAYSINHNPNEANTVQYHHSHLHPSCTSHPHQPHALPTPNPPIPIHPSLNKAHCSNSSNLILYTEPQHTARHNTTQRSPSQQQHSTSTAAQGSPKRKERRGYVAQSGIAWWWCMYVDADADAGVCRL